MLSSIPNPPTVPQQILGLMKTNTPIANPQLDTLPDQPAITPSSTGATEPEKLSAQPTMTKMFSTENDEAAENLETLQAQPIVLPDASHVPTAVMEAIKPLAHDQDWDEVNKSQVTNITDQQVLKNIPLHHNPKKESNLSIYLLIALLASVLGIALGLFTDIKHYLKVIQVPKQQINLQIQTQPQGAKVMIQGIEQGQTPFQKSIELGGKKLDLQIKLKDHVPYERLIDIDPLQERFYLDIQMQKEQKP
jgi:hypothetical protein